MLHRLVHFGNQLLENGWRRIFLDCAKNVWLQLRPIFRSTRGSRLSLASLHRTSAHILGSLWRLSLTTPFHLLLSEFLFTLTLFTFLLLPQDTLFFFCIFSLFLLHLSFLLCFLPLSLLRFLYTPLRLCLLSSFLLFTITFLLLPLEV